MVGAVRGLLIRKDGTGDDPLMISLYHHHNVDFQLTTIYHLLHPSMLAKIIDRPPNWERASPLEYSNPFKHPKLLPSLILRRTSIIYVHMLEYNALHFE